jgi:hypothetical protein
MARFARIGWVSRQVAAAVCLTCFLPLPLPGQTKGNRLLPRYVTVAPPDQAEGARILGEFRQLGLPGEYYLEFVLEVLPRRGSRFEVPGQLWGSRNEEGPITRLVLRPTAPAPEERLLVQNGVQAQAWQWRGGAAAPTPLRAEDLLKPLAGTQATAFDLQMPFIFWSEFVFEGVTKIRGRTAHAFLLYPPAEFASAHPGVGGVRIYLDLQFHALMQAAVLDQNERSTRTLTVLDLKKIGPQWIVKSIDVRDETTRDKTRFRVTGASLDLELNAQLFTAEQLPSPIQPPAQVERIN